MVKWQIQTGQGLQMGLFDGFTAIEALNNMAKSKGHETFSGLCESLGIKPAWKEFPNFRIIWL
ncbi:MAG: hypothetical protein WBC70_06050 [Candidatus Aminicenantales bacterium]